MSKAVIAPGNPAPLFTLKDTLTERPIALADYVGRDVLLVFLRGMHCPYCWEHLRILSENYARLQSVNTEIIAVICQSRWIVRPYLQAKAIPFPVLCDEKREIAKAYGTHYWFTYEGFNLSHPALFILDRKGRVTFAHVGKRMSDLPIAFLLERFFEFLKESQR